MAAAADERPDAAAGQRALQRGEPRLVGEDMLIEAQLAAGTDHATQVSERRADVGHGAQHRRHDGGVESLMLERELPGQAVDDVDARWLACGVDRALAQDAPGSTAITSSTVEG